MANAFYLHWVVCVCFFFQAEDGIRDAQESRGLGDVYKRQVCRCAAGPTICAAQGLRAAGLHLDLDTARGRAAAVSYTHLTLPTIYSV